MRVLVTDLSTVEFLKKRTEFLEKIYKNVPCGVGKDGRVKLSNTELHEVLNKGSNWAVKEGYGTKKDLDKTEEYGNMKQADSGFVSQKALSRGIPQIGTLGSGNHFLEVQKVDQIFDEKIAKVYGVKKDCVAVMLHCGSRGLGHQVASDYIYSMEKKFGVKHLPDRQLINAPVHSDIGQEYFKAMCASANFAFVNRQMIMHWARETFERVYGGIKVDLMYDIAHNICKLEKYKIDKTTKPLYVMRKGATRAFGPGHEELPEMYQKTGQPILIPGSMGTASYILAGTNEADMVSFSSSAHGAGRIMSRFSALKKYRGEQIKEELSSKNIEVKSRSWKGLAEEAPGVYKDVDEVIRVTDGAGIGKRIVRLVPLAVIKG